MEQVRLGELRPALFELHADRAAAEVRSLDECGADPPHRADHDVTRVGVGLDHPASEFGKHLRRVAVGLGQVAAAALPLARALRARPDRERDVVRLG
jgi:hypothetical protein